MNINCCLLLTTTASADFTDTDQTLDTADYWYTTNSLHSSICWHNGDLNGVSLIQQSALYPVGLRMSAVCKFLWPPHTNRYTCCSAIISQPDNVLCRHSRQEHHPENRHRRTCSYFRALESAVPTFSKA